MAFQIYNGIMYLKPKTFQIFLINCKITQQKAAVSSARFSTQILSKFMWSSDFSDHKLSRILLSFLKIRWSSVFSDHNMSRKLDIDGTNTIFKIYAHILRKKNR